MSHRSFKLQFVVQIASLCWLTWAVAAPPDAVPPNAAPPNAAAKNAANESGRVATYQSATGENYFAFSYSVKSTPQAAQPKEVVVLIDTSASQTGAFRDDTMAALQSMLAGLTPQDRVKLVAVDINAVPLTEGFVPPAGAAIQSALANLNRRVPLGSTDMFGALKAASASFGKPTGGSRSVVYMGDGVSRAKVANSEEFAGVLKDFTDKRISVSSLAIGPARNVELLATIANHTGGAVVVDSDDVTGQQQGQAMAKAVHATVYWPVSAKFSDDVVEGYPKNLPPVRSDRDAIVIGKLKNAGGAPQLKATFEVNGEIREHTWSIPAEKSSPDFSFLPKLVEYARPDGGLRLPTLGSAGLREVAHAISVEAERIAQLGTHALATGDIAGAKSAAASAIAQDPTNPTAIAIQLAAEEVEANPNAAAAAAANATDLNLAPAKEESSEDSLSLSEGGAGKLLDTVEEMKRVQAQVVQTEVENGLNAARQKVTTAPDLAINDLKLLLDNVDRATELEADVRSQLRDRIATALRQAEAKKIEVESNRETAQEAQVAAIESIRLAEITTRKRLKMKQLMDRFNSLLEEGKYRVAEEDIAEQIRAMEPSSSLAASAIWNSRFLKNVKEMARFRDIKHRNFVDTLYFVEESSIPIPDEPPIVYPKAEIWEQLTLSRAKYKSVDLAGTQGGAEQRIAQLLDKEDNFIFPDTSLQDVVDTLISKMDIPIVIDKKALEDAGVGTDQTVNTNLRGITLRSALRLILGELELTYMIQDEVLQITTAEKAGEKLITKVYPVGDLVIPVISGGMGGGGMMGGMGGGMMGGMGGGMGGMGGGMGGMGGGMGGMGGGGFGGGGGFFAVNDESAPAPNAEPKKPAAPKQPATPKPGSTGREELKPIQLQVPAGQSREEAWEQYFRSHANDSAADQVSHAAQVRETVRQLRSEAAANLEDAPEVAESKFQEILVIMQAALRNRQVQPWMYEAMSLAMMATDQPTEEIERALMSAVDFSRNEDEVMNVAGYMVRVGLDERALKLYREVAAQNPLRPEPYVAGLAIAKRLKDESAIRWACLGILSQAWPSEHRQIEADARRSAEALLVQMEKANRKQDRQQFITELNNALLRDCVVKVTWTGNADIDLLVEEPSATVCSLQNRRTTSGGVLVGDTFSNPRADSADGFSEYYVCPNGYSGLYRLMIRKVWGKVTAGKVTVEIVTNYGGKEQTYGKQQIPLGDKNAIVNFEVKNGRRAEPIEAEMIANLERAKLNAGQAILAQQFGDPLGQNANPNNSGSTSTSGSVPLFPVGFVPSRFDPRFGVRRGAVGYMPVITQLPEGNQLAGLAIISADRRYVRFTLFGDTPISSSITDVQTFSFASANSQTGGGIGGGGGGIGGGGIGGGGGGFGGGGQF